MAVVSYYGWGKHSDWMLQVGYSSYPFADPGSLITLTYVSEHGSVPEPLTFLSEDGELVFYFTEEMLSPMTADGYKFDGWLYEGSPPQTGTAYWAASTEITLTAQWSEAPQPAAMRVKTDDGYALVYPETAASQVKTDSGTDLQTVLSNIQSAISDLGGSVDI